MQSDMQTAPGSKKVLWAGRIVSALPVLLMGVGAIVTLFNSGDMTKGIRDMGYPEHLARPLLFLEIACVILYVIPQTAVLGAVLLTGYLGGAVATHVRVGDPFYFIPVIVGVVVWLGLYLRDARLRALIPLRR